MSIVTCWPPTGTPSTCTSRLLAKADMVVISKDYLQCPVDEIKDIETLLTMVGGRVVYSKDTTKP